MAFNPLSGSSALFQAVSVALTSGSDLVTPTGSETLVTISEAAKYDFDQQSTSVSFIGFNNGADATTKVIDSRELAGGTGSWTLTISGAFSADSNAVSSFTRFKRGMFLSMNLYLEKSTTFGYKRIIGKVISLKQDGDVQGTSPQGFAITVKGDGAIPTPTAA